MYFIVRLKVDQGAVGEVCLRVI